MAEVGQLQATDQAGVADLLESIPTTSKCDAPAPEEIWRGMVALDMDILQIDSLCWHRPLDWIELMGVRDELRL
ncbi:MAG: hypothetical protein M1821_006461 [Bathelium mastoideum]|nr:MAG: hypothetical protein M1821_006461 [Bathelium mastoideum]